MWWRTLGERPGSGGSSHGTGADLSPEPRFASLVEVLHWRATHQPDRAFLTYLADGERIDQRLTFGELDARARRVAAQLADRARPGDRALLLYPSGPEFVTAFFGCLYAGIVAIPAYPPRNARHLPRIAAILHDADVRLILTVSEVQPRIAAWLAATPEAGACSMIGTDAGTLPDPGAWTPAYPDPDSLAFLQYTSGSTGQPKGVMISHANIIANQRVIQEAFGHDADSTVISWLPVFHDMGLVGNLMQPLYLGSQVILMAPAAFLQKPFRWLRAVSDFRGRTTGAPNFAYDLASRSITAEQRATLDLRCLELAYNGSEPVDARVLDRFATTFAECGLRREVLYPCYGMAETTLMATAWTKGVAPRALTVDADALERHRVREARSASAARTIVSCGRSIPDQTLRIVDPQTRQALGDGEVGEIWLAGPHVARGYWNRPDLTAQAFEARVAGSDEGPFLRTGDLGFVADGEVFVAGRLKDVIIIRGRNYYPQDIERAVEPAHPALQPGGGAAFVSEAGGPARLVVAHEVQRSAIRGLDPAAAGQAIARVVAEEFELQVHTVVLLAPLSLPKTSSGKIQRGACRERFERHELETVGTWSVAPAVTGPVDPRPGGAPPAVVDLEQLRRWAIDAIAGRTGYRRDDIDTTIPFASFGLDSLAVVELSGALSAWLKRDLSPTLLYDYPTVDALCRHLAGEGAAAAASRPDAPQAVSEPLAVIGIGCRLPGGVSDVTAFWRLLRDGVDAIGEVPAGRWATPVDSAAGEATAAAPRHGGFIADVDRFDPHFFGISPREAVAMDPQQRLLLEVAWEALEDAAVAPDALAGSDTGVFVGISTSDYAGLPRSAEDRARLQAYDGTGRAFSAAAGRISYLLGLQGPSLAVDTACSSSLVAVHLACQSLQAGECDVALAGGVNLLLSPDLTATFAKAGMMAPDGRCKAFDASADGYVRSEGCGVVVLRRLSAAIAAGDRIHAVVRGSAVNQDGRSNGFTAPNGPAQERVVRRALAVAGLGPADIGYVEAHGTGTALGDPIEVGALAAVFAGSPHRIGLGSVKTNVGHLEAAAGITGLIKAILVLQQGEMPPTLHVRRLNPLVAWDRTPFEVTTSPMPWMGDGVPRAGVSSFGFTGTNAHVILERAPSLHLRGEVAATATAAVPAAPAGAVVALPPEPMVLAVSAPQASALGELTERYRRHLERATDEIGDLCFTAGAGRQHFPHRVAVVGASREDLARRLAEATPSAADPRFRLAALFTGQGAQYAGMGRLLYDSEPVFRAAVDRCDAAFRSARDRSLHAVLYPASGDRSPIDATEFTQPALFAIEYALSELWSSWGITASALLGHSVGEYVAACVAGVFSPEDGMRLVAARGRLMQALPEPGAMMAVFADAATAAPHLRGLSPLAIAAINTDAEVVVAGRREALAALAARLDAAAIGHRPLNVSHAFHSPLMDPMIEAFREVLGTVRFAPPRIPVVSNVSGTPAGDAMATPDYWVGHVTATVRFADGLRWLEADGCTHALEIGPRPVLSRFGADLWRSGPGRLVPSLTGGAGDDRTTLRQALAALYLGGAAIDWTAVYPRRRRVALPTYPFQRQRCWLAPPDAEDRATAPSAAELAPPAGVLGRRLSDVATLPGVRMWETAGAAASAASWAGNTVGGIDVLPASTVLDLVLAAAHEIFGDRPHDLRDVRFLAAAPTPLTPGLRLQIAARPLGDDLASCEVHVSAAPGEPWKAIATASCGLPARPAGRRPGAPAPAFGLMFFNGTETRDRRDSYRLFIEASRFADRHGFSSVWTPERHYTEFGGLYPNPGVLLAALARETRRVRLMAGSLVLPLHHPFRVAEDWSLLDNLSGGRVGISVAPGWNPDDFAMFPDRYADRHDIVFRHLEVIRRLWRGEAVEARSGSGRPTTVTIHPAPVQREFPVWVTAAGNPRTFERAGAAGANLLTHLLDQDVPELAAKIAGYRAARARAGHDPDAGRVTVMVHTFLGRDLEVVRDQTREPYCEYIKANIGLLKGLAFSRGGDLDVAALSPRDLDEFVGFLFERFFSTRALLGTPESCAELVSSLQRAGTDEIACLIDFGPPADAVIDSLPYLHELMRRVAGSSADAAVAPGVAAEAPATIQARCREQMPGAAFYRRLASRGVEFRDHQQPVDRCWRRDGEALVRLRPAAEARAGGAAASDREGALHAFMAAIPADAFDRADTAVFVPVDLGTLRVIQPGMAATWSHAWIHGQHDDEAAFVGSIRLLDAQGTTVAELADLSVRRRDSQVAPAAHANRVNDWLYGVRWIEAPIEPAASPAGGPAHWIVLADRKGFGDALSRRLRQDGHDVTFVTAASRAPDDGQGGPGLDPLDRDAFLALMRSAAAASRPLAGVVHAWSLDAAATDDLSTEALRRAEDLGCAALLHAVQALVATGQRCPVWVVTEMAQATGHDGGAPAVAQAPVWGLGRVVSLEHPEQWGGLIDLEAGSTHAAAVDALIAELDRRDGEDQVAVRQGRRLVPRLERDEMPPATAPRLDPEATYLITGGTGALGRRVAHWMVKRGARHLVLTGLHPLPDRAAWNVRDTAVAPAVRERIAGIQSLEGQGAEVMLLFADASDRDAMVGLFAEARASGRPLRGIVHLAGLPETQAIGDITFAASRRVLAPKVEGAYIVHEQSLTDPLDFFVAFASISAVWGSRGQPLYAAANHFLEALHAYRVRRGLPSTCVSWGPWSEGGMVSRDGLRALAKMGVLPIDPADATGVLGRIMQTGPSSHVVADVAWDVFTDLFEARGRRPLLASIRASVATGAATTTTPMRQALDAMADPDRRAQMVRHLQQEVALVLGWPAGEYPDPRAGFFEMGMDSLTALELKNRLQAALGLTLRATVVFNHSRIEPLADFLLTEMGLGPRPAAPTRHEPAVVPDDMDDATLLTLLDRQLEAIEASGTDDSTVG